MDLEHSKCIMESNGLIIGRPVLSLVHTVNLLVDYFVVTVESGISVII